MAVYAVGDLHGCHDAFCRLLELIRFNPENDRLWLVGDIVNRGPQSLELLRWVYRHQHCTTMVLGNHDLHLLAVAAGAVAGNDLDTIDDIINAPDQAELCDFLRRQPLAHCENGWLMVHAGVLPMWSLEDILTLADEAQTVIRGEQWEHFVHQMYGDQPASWDDSLRGADRWRVIINALTRLRICTPAGELSFNYNGTLDNIPAGYVAWFDAPGRRSGNIPIICGHWSSLGLILRDNLCTLDTSYLWRQGELTAMRLADRQIFQIGHD